MQLPAPNSTSDPTLYINITMPSDDNPSPTFDLFVYGTLMVPAILLRVVGHDGANLKFQDALLSDFTRHHVKDEDYPAIVGKEQLDVLLGESATKLTPDELSTRGTLVSGLTAMDMKLIDVFESTEYARKEVTVQTFSQPAPLSDLPPELLDPAKRTPNPKATGKANAIVYLWTDPVERLTPGVWSFAEFLRDKAADWAGASNEYAEVDAARETTRFGVDGDGVVGRHVDGFPDFGHNMRKYWGFGDDWVCTNHGSYGSPPLAVVEAREKLAREIDQRVDVWMRRKIEPMLDQVRADLAPIVNADCDEVVIVPNATHGINTIATNIDFDDGDIIVVYASTYGAVSQTMKYLCDRHPGIRLEVILVTFPCLHADIVKATEAVLAKYNQPTGRVRGGDAPATPTGIKANERVRLLVIDSIASTPGVIYPWEQVVSLCHQYGVLSLVDAAHSIGQHHVDLHKVDPDFFVTNCHKWLTSHRGAALMYVPFRNQRLIRSSFPTGHFYESERYPTEGGNHPWTFARQYSWNGTADFTSFLTVSDAIRFRQRIGGEDRIIAYNHSLAVAGAKRVAKRWGTQWMENDKGELTACMFNIQLPRVPIPTDTYELYQLQRFMEDILMYEYSTFASPYIHNGSWWVRFSAQVWVELGDFDYVADAYLDIIERVVKGEWRNAVPL